MRWALRVVSIASLAFVVGPSECGLETGTKDVGAPCTRDGECLPELVCTSGVCASVPDASPDAADAE
ncbi:MAG: hypothetical protein H6721_23275 [Sandaracinus sp.]|nr:hypothetical protein [Myxococcales bacterium]MCB9599686.1 hypothetical protein [Sandaracinus sp.]MCB9635058.1 hypothetical protein [Sandaracinus sp.]